MKNYDEDINKVNKGFRNPAKRRLFGSTFLISFVIIGILLIGGLIWHNSFESLQFEDKINNELLFKMNNQGISYIKLDEEQKYKFYVKENLNYSPSFFIEFIERGDIITKNSKSDTIYVHRENEKFIFLIKRYLKK